MIEPPNLRPLPGQGTIDPSSRSIAARRRLGNALARKKLPTAATELRRERERMGGDDIWGTGEDVCMPPLLFRRSDATGVGSAFGGTGLSRRPPYRNVAFMNNEVVVASRDDLLFDVVRLPHEVGVVDRTEDGEGKGRRRRRGKLLADRSGTPSHNGDGSGVKLCRLDDGRAFLAGLPSGEFQIFSTEHGSTAWSGAIPNSEKMDGPFLRTMLRIAPPSRRYWREWNRPELSLSGLLSRKPSANLSDLIQIPDYDTNPPPLQLCSRRKVAEGKKPFLESLWDFRETGSTLLAAHVHPQLDCFSIHTLDKHVHHTPHPGASEPSIYVDAASRGAHEREDITSVCFVGAWGIATAHVRRTEPGGSTDGEVVNFLKLWDRRYVTNGRGGKGRKGKRDGSVRLVSFPKNEAVSSSAVLEKCVARPGGRGWDSELVDPAVGEAVERNSNCLPIVCLSAPLGDCSDMVCVSLHGSEPIAEDFMEPHGTTEDLLVDTVHPTIARRIQLTSNVHDTVSHLPIFATDLGVMARYYCQVLTNSFADNMKETVLLYDLSQPPPPLAALRRDEYNTINSRQRRKRRHEEDGTSARALPQCAIGDGAYVTLPLALIDEDSLPSGTTCLALSHDGTSLVVGSEDGDLFLY